MTDTRYTIADMLAKLGPEQVKNSLVRAGLFIVGYELMKSQIVDATRGFFVIGFDEHGLTTDEKYESKVRSRHKKEFEACLLWLVSMEALTEAQADRVRAIRDHRNELAHELPRYVTNPGAEVDTKLLREMRDVIALLGRFWGSIEVSIDPQFDGEDVDLDGIVSGTTLLVDLLIDASEISNEGAPNGNETSGGLR